MQARVLVSVFANFLTGALTGLLGGLVMALLDYLSQLAWGQQVLRGFPSQAPVVWQFLLPLITGLAIGLLRRAGAKPLPELHVTLAQLSQTNEQQKRLDLSFRGSHLLLGLLALVGGGS
ncbi:MAG: chloride channel protein, partial [Synechococcaceae bacterium WB4_2_0805]|nr:chloride channel protein [Synechococcaceae bacterium WB4_2_0805]